MSTWTISEIIIIIGVILAPISTFVFMAGGLLNFSHAVKKLMQELSARQQDANYKDVLLTYLLTREAGQRSASSPASPAGIENVEYTPFSSFNTNMDFYQPKALPLGNNRERRSKLKGFVNFVAGFMTAVVLLFVFVLLS